MSVINDPDVQVLAGLALGLQSDYTDDDLRWNGSPFAWIKTRPPRQVGTIGEKLVAGFLATKDFNVTRSPDTQADRLIEGRRAEIKFSTLWAGGFYKFQQLRKQNYDFVFCLGVSPFNAHCWVLDKAEVMRRWDARDGIEPQHGGAGGSDTAWMSVNPAAPYPWLSQYGGTLAKAVEVLSKITGFVPKLSDAEGE